MTTGTINIDYDDKSNRFIIHSPFWALGLMRAIPNRKFEKRLNNAWTAPALRANIAYLKDKMPTQAVYTSAAKAKIRDVLEPKPDVSLPFPNDYVFKTEPYDHQMMALNAAYGRKKFAMFMDMRTGKTKTVIDLTMAMFYAGLLERVVIIPLKTLRRNWGREYGIHADLAAVDIHYLEAGEEKQFRAWEAKDTGKLKVLLVGIESMSAGKAIDHVLQFQHGPKSMVVIDESDSIKNHKAIRTEKMFEVRDKSEYRVILTGTPISKGPMDFFAQFEFLDPNIIGIGDFYSFRNRYAIMGGFGDKEIVGYQNMDELTELVKPYVYQVKYSDVFKSPPQINEIRTVRLTDQQAAIYKSIKKDGTIRNDGNIKLIVQNVLEKMLRLQEVCGGFWAERVNTGQFTEDPISKIKKPKFKYNHYPIEGENPKLEALVDVLTREYADDQGIVWAIHIEELKMIARRLADFGTVGLLHGGVSEEDRNQLDQDFRSGKIKWIVANPTTGGRGYTFDAADVMVNFSYSHSYIHRRQSLERATSAKKTKPVMVIDIVTERTVDEVVLDALESKQDVADFVRDRLSSRTTVDDLVF